MACRFWSSTCSSPGTSCGRSPGPTSARWSTGGVHDRRGARDLQGGDGADHRRLQEGAVARADRPRQRRASRRHHGRVLRRQDAAEPGGDALRARGDAAGDPALRQERGGRDREVHQGIRSGPQPAERRQAHPGAHPAAQRGAAARAREAHAQARRGLPRVGAQPPPRRSRDAEGAGEGSRDHRGRPAARGREDRNGDEGDRRSAREAPEDQRRRDHGGVMIELDHSRLPRHVAVIMDGNGRWAEQRGLSRLYGHRVGKDSVRAIVESSRKLGIKYLSLFAFSSENWNRPPREVDGLMALLRKYLASELGKMMRHGIRLLAVGSLRKLPPAVREALRSSIAATRNNTGMTVILAVSYGGREDIARAARAIARNVERGKLAPGQITEETVAEHLGTKGVPDPDLLIRTSGEMRISNFFLWQLAYTEMYITETLWPDFREREYFQALAFFQQRQRRFGRTAAQLERERLRAV